VLGETGFVMIAIAAMLATASSVNSNIFAGGNLTLTLSELTQFPPIFGTPARFRGTRGVTITGGLVLIPSNTRASFPNAGAAKGCLVGARDIREVARVPGGPEGRSASTDDQQRRPLGQRFGAPADGRFGDRKGCAACEMSLFSIELERRSTFEHEVKLLLAALSLVVILNERLTGLLSHEEVDAERVDPEYVLERVPHGVIRIAL
jgi:hypothetical protein